MCKSVAGRRRVKPGGITQRNAQLRCAPAGASLRHGGSRGCINLFCAGDSGTDHSPGALIPLGVIGTTARVADNAHLVLPAGLGNIFSREHPDGTYIHFSIGVLFDAGKRRK